MPLNLTKPTPFWDLFLLYQILLLTYLQAKWTQTKQDFFSTQLLTFPNFRTGTDLLATGSAPEHIASGRQVTLLHLRLIQLGQQIQLLIWTNILPDSVRSYVY